MAYSEHGAFIGPGTTDQVLSRKERAMELPNGYTVPFSLAVGPSYIYIKLAAATLGALLWLYSIVKSSQKECRRNGQSPGLFRSFMLFFYSCFVQPHKHGRTNNQQDSLERFYKKQATGYDATREFLLRGREDMLALAAADLKAKDASVAVDESSGKHIWVDIGGGTGWNIEAMSRFVDVSRFFSSIYLVDFSPSLCEVAKARFHRLGLTNVTVVCQDARTFRLEDFETDLSPSAAESRSCPWSEFVEQRPKHADLVTMSYSLSMIPDFFSVVDSVSSLLSPRGVFGVVDFYVQSKVDFLFRNFTGGFSGRHVNVLSRAFWRTWFDIDRVSLEPSRRDYLEYRFGTLHNLNCRNRLLGFIPYYIWLGCQKSSSSRSSLVPRVQEVDSRTTESPYLHPTKNREGALSRAIQHSAPENRSKAFLAALNNLNFNLPRPSFFYQNRSWRVYYDDQLQKHTQFNDQYIYAFTWEDARVDERLLDLHSDDVVVAISSAGDNILSYLAQGVARVHAVDLNPAQNHLLELKAAAYTALPYEDFWKLFGDGVHADFRNILLSKLSPHLSSRAFQFWVDNANVFQRKGDHAGLYDTGGSRHALRAFRWMSQIFGVKSSVKGLLQARTLNEQREFWRDEIRPALLSKIMCRLVVSQKRFLWSALGVPKNQLRMIEDDHAALDRKECCRGRPKRARSCAIWHYMVNTLDPIVENTYVGIDNPYYFVCLAGRFSRKCHPHYLSPRSHAKLSRPEALDGLRIHTDELEEVIGRMEPLTITIAVVMDSMDWFDAGSNDAAEQITKLNRVLKMGGRVLLRSAALNPWYIKTFERLGFQAKCHGSRRNKACIDRVNMYASCWICTKKENLPPPSPEMEPEGPADVSSMRL